MDFGWTAFFNSFWILPILCLSFMAVMMFACRGMRSCCCHGTHKKPPLQSGPSEAQRNSS